MSLKRTWIFSLVLAIELLTFGVMASAADARRVRRPAPTTTTDSNYSTGTYSGTSSGYSSSNYSSSYSGGEHQQYVSGLLGIMSPGYNTITGTANGTDVNVNLKLSGFFAIGGDYEYGLSKDFSIGGIFRYYYVSTTQGGATIKNSLLAIGPIIRTNINVGNWTIAVDTGLPIMSPGYSQTSGGTTTDVSFSLAFGLRFGLGFLYHFSDTIAFGIENAKYYGITNSYNGILVDDYMLKARFAL